MNLKSLIASTALVASLAACDSNGPDTETNLVVNGRSYYVSGTNIAQADGSVTTSYAVAIPEAFNGAGGSFFCNSLDHCRSQIRGFQAGTVKPQPYQTVKEEPG